MTLFTTKNLLAAATLGLILPLSAQARPYDVCYADTGDAIGCWLSEKLGGDYTSTSATPIRQKKVLRCKPSERKVT